MSGGQYNDDDNDNDDDDLDNYVVAKLQIINNATNLHETVKREPMLCYVMVKTIHTIMPQHFLFRCFFSFFWLVWPYCCCCYWPKNLVVIQYI